MTVSRAGRDHPEIKTRILRLAREMGYRPNPLVSALMARLGETRETRSDTPLAIVSPATIPQDALARFGLVLEGVERRATQLGFTINNLMFSGNQAKLRLTLRARGIAAVVWLPGIPADLLVAIKLPRVASVVIGQPFTACPYHRGSVP